MININKDELLYIILRNEPVEKSTFLKEKYPDINISELRLRIINYQIDKYGHQKVKESEKINRNYL